MSKTAIIVSFLLPFLAGNAQQPGELLVYSVKGKALVSNNITGMKDQPLKIGSVLHLKDVIKTETGTSLVLVCNSGKSLQIKKEGTFYVENWKDSCRDPGRSVTSSYFRFIWSQLYSYSPENMEAKRKRSDMAVVRGEHDETPARPSKLSISKGMDTVNYAALLDNFPLSWTYPGYKGQYIFRLYNEKATKLIFQDTLRTNFILISRFREKLDPGKKYKWTVSAKNGGTSKKRILNYLESPGIIDTYITGLQAPFEAEEDSAAASFRVGYMLEKKHYLESAFLWYERAEAASPDNPLFRDQLIRFRNEFWIR